MLDSIEGIAESAIAVDDSMIKPKWWLEMQDVQKKCRQFLTTYI